MIRNGQKVKENVSEEKFTHNPHCELRLACMSLLCYAFGMNILTLTIRPSIKQERKVRVELDAEQFERLAAGLGFFTSQFVASVDRAEKEIAEDKTRRLRSLKDFRRV